MSADTEIDWRAYMQQVEQYVSGERDYTMIKGDTGPLVYPAGHVYVYKALYDLTEQGTNILYAQCIFAVVYIFNEALAMWCYYEAEVSRSLPLLPPSCGSSRKFSRRTPPNAHVTLTRMPGSPIPPPPPDPL